MKTRKSVYWLLMLVLGVGALLFFSRKQEPAEASISDKTHAQVSTPTNQMAEVRPTAAPQEAGATKVVTPAVFFESINVPVRFWGRVVDQDEKPIAGSKISLTVRQWHMTPIQQTRGDFKNLERLSDSDGRFQIEGERGDVLTVQAITKEGYELSPKAQKSFGYNISTNISPDPERPVVFRMWRVQAAEPLVIGKKFVRVVPDGRAYSINLAANTITPGEAKGADLHLRLKRPGNVSREDKFDWSLSIEAVQASLIQTNAEFMFVAPASGYTTNYLFEARSDSQEWARRIKRSFFLKTGGSNFARMEIDAFGFYDGEAAVEINFALNPSGSTNLRFDRKAQPVQTQFE